MSSDGAVRHPTAAATDDLSRLGHGGTVAVE